MAHGFGPTSRAPTYSVSVPRRPLSVRRGGVPSAEWEALYDDPPPWLVQTLVSWMIPVVANRVLDQWDFQNDRLLRCQRELHLTHTEWSKGPAITWQSIVDEAMVAGRLNDLLDWAVGNCTKSQHLDALTVALEEGGSAWRVGVTADGPELQHRVDSTVTLAIEEAASGTRAGLHLKNAWSAVYGRSPRPSEGYREAIRAVESAGAAVISPANPHTTLGTMIADIKAKPAKWSVALQRTSPSSDPIQPLIGMMELLWKSQLDRHGSSDEDVPISVGQKEAEGAVHLAATLVHWFLSGVITSAENAL